MPILRQCHGSDTRHVHAGMRIFQRIASINTVSPAGIAQNWPREVPLLTVLFDKIYVPCRSKCCVTAVPVSSRTAAGPSFGPGTLRSKCCVPAVPRRSPAVPVSPAIPPAVPRVSPAVRLLFCAACVPCCSAAWAPVPRRIRDLERANSAAVDERRSVRIQERPAIACGDCQ